MANKQFCLRGRHDTFVVGRNTRGQCRECQREANRRYSATEKGRETRREANRRYNATEARREAQREANRRYTEANPDRTQLRVIKQAQRRIAERRQRTLGQIKELMSELVTD